jgi:hypothetical protein
VRSGARIVAAAAVLVLAVAAGCGGGGGPLTKAEYEQKLQQAGRALTTALRELSRSNSKDEFKRGVDAVEKALNDAADELDGVTPPQDVEGANNRVVEAFRLLSHDFERVKAAAEKGPDAAREAGRQVTTGAASREANQAIKEIQRRGYEVGQLGS